MLDFMERIKEEALKNGMDPEEFARLAEKMKLPTAEEIAHSVQAQRDQQEKIRRLSPEALAALTDDGLYDAVLSRLEGKETLTRVQAAFYVAAKYDMEMQNGGLCQFFVNCSAMDAACLEEALATIGAEDHRAYFHSFVTEHKINLEDLPEFSLDFEGDWQSEYADAEDRYPFDAYDEAFYAMPPLFPILVTYIRTHLEQF